MTLVQPSHIQVQTQRFLRRGADEVGQVKLYFFSLSSRLMYLSRTKDSVRQPEIVQIDTFSDDTGLYSNIEQQLLLLGTI